MTMKSPARILPPLTAPNASSSRSNTRAVPRNTSSAWPATFATHPSGARLPRRIAMPPWRPLGDDLPWQHTPLQHVHDELAGLERDLLLARIHSGHVVKPHRRDPEHLERGRHRVGRELTAASAPARARPALDRAELLRVDL